MDGIITPTDFVRALGGPDGEPLCRHVCATVLDSLGRDGVRREGTLRVPSRFVPASGFADSLMSTVPTAVTSSLGQTLPALKTLRVFRSRPPLVMVKIRVDETVDIGFVAMATHVEITVDAASSTH